MMKRHVLKEDDQSPAIDGGMWFLRTPTGPDVSVELEAILGTIGLCLSLVLGGLILFDLSIGQAIAGGVILTILHWMASVWHHLGHAWIAYRTGYPMAEIRLGQWFIFASSVYPKDEEELPSEVHVRRALGGPVSSTLLSIAAGLIAWSVYPAGGLSWFIALIFFLDCSIMFTLGCLLPLGFTDGSTLLRHLS